MNAGRQITGSNDLGYDPEVWVPSEPSAANEVEEWLTRLNDDAANDDALQGETARALLKAVARKVAMRRGA
jgi:hypothetical protein